MNDTTDPYEFESSLDISGVRIPPGWVPYPEEEPWAERLRRWWYGTGKRGRPGTSSLPDMIMRARMLEVKPLATERHLRKELNKAQKRVKDLEEELSRQARIFMDRRNELTTRVRTLEQELEVVHQFTSAPLRIDYIGVDKMIEQDG